MASTRCVSSSVFIRFFTIFVLCEKWVSKEKKEGPESGFNCVKTLSGLNITTTCGGQKNFLFYRVFCEQKMLFV